MLLLAGFKQYPPTDLVDPDPAVGAVVHGVVVDVDVVAGPGHLQYSTVQYGTVQYSTVLTTPRPTNFLDLTSLSAWAWARVRAALGPVISRPEISTRVTCVNQGVVELSTNLCEVSQWSGEGLH